MSRSFLSSQHVGLAIAMLVSSLARAADEPPSMRRWVPYVLVSGEADDADGSQAMFELGSSIGSGWIRGGIGRAQLADTDYDIETDRPILARFSLLNGSAITRSEAFLDRAFAAGMTYYPRRASLTAQYMHDEALVEDDVTDSLQLSLLFPLGDHWSLTPIIGVSDNDFLGETAYGGLSAGYTW